MKYKVNGLNNFCRVFLILYSFGGSNVFKKEK